MIKERIILVATPREPCAVGLDKIRRNHHKTKERRKNTKMKKTLTTIATLVGSIAILNAQSNNTLIVTTPGGLSTNGNFFATAFNYFTSFNPALTNTFSTNNGYQAWIGASYQTGVYLGGVVGLESQPLQGSLHGLTLRTVETLAPQVGTLSDAEFDLGYSFTHIDLRITPFVGVDDNILGHATGCAFGVELEKALTDNTFAGIYFEGKSDDGNRTTKQGQLVIGIFGGATF
jgi:hypothetical protein